uniref:Uncharacterized protein LOC104241686 n=1 Tax=Nicotiana sylvestris TaxID=4096 RepID=A0A1U7Y7Y2_NICSY|nr:PREDICTED: uncharacterized protein LOC104241686 [Nicotiana sylvestris]
MKAIEAKNGEQYAENKEWMQEQNQEGEQNIKDRTNSKKKKHKKKKMPRKKSIVLFKPAIIHGQSKANKVINKKGKQHTITEQLASEILGSEAASQQKADLVANEDQQVTLCFKGNCISDDSYVTAVYAKCSATERKALWESLENMANIINEPWCTGGDFNVIMESREKLGGSPYRAYKSFDFVTTMETCGLIDIVYVGPKHTWCNNRRPRKRIWNRLDRILINDQWAQKFQQNYVRHLVRTGSDHRPLLMKCRNDQQEVIKYFKFLNFWVHQPGFMDIVQDLWITQFNNWEVKVQQLEELDLLQNSKESREELNKAHAEYVKWPENEYLTAIPDMEEIREAIFNLSQHSAASPDGFNGVFFQTCRVPYQLLRIKTHQPNQILAGKQNTLLPKLISDNQSGFVKGRLITETVMLAQEIIQGIGKDNKGDIILRLVSDAWYSIVINGSRRGFFTSSQGLKQGDPLSPSLFIIAAEVLSRSLNKLHYDIEFTPFHMNQRCPPINHLAYEDDIVIFSADNNKSVRLIMQQVSNYERASGQKVNDDKIFFLIDPKARAQKSNKMRITTGFMEKGRLFTCGGRIVLIKRVLQSLPIYTLSAMSPPKWTLNLIERVLQVSWQKPSPGKIKVNTDGSYFKETSKAGIGE